MKPYLLIFLCIACTTAFSQFKNDQVLYKTVYPEDLCKTLKKNPGYLLLDVRSPGEFNDTSQSFSLNIGHLENAMNIDIRQFGQRLNEISGYKNKPVFVYCSHSQRSRRVSKMLADSGFTDIHNINGGMTALHLMNSDPCLETMIKTNVSYNLISPIELCSKMKGGKVFLLDVRPDSVWTGTGRNQRLNSIGFLKGTKHISFDILKENISQIDKEKEIIITDVSGYDAAKAAALLNAHGFKKVSVLVEGMDRWTAFDKKQLTCADLYNSKMPFSIINSFSLNDLSTSKDVLFLDVRSADEFANKHKDAFRNIGQVKNVKHIPAENLIGRLSEITDHKNKPVIVYAFSGNPEAYSSAKILSDNGFKDVRVLSGGLFNIRWTAANVAGMQRLNEWVVNVPEENK